MVCAGLRGLRPEEPSDVLQGGGGVAVVRFAVGLVVRLVRGADALVLVGGDVRAGAVREEVLGKEGLALPRERPVQEEAGGGRVWSVVEGEEGSAGDVVGIGEVEELDVVHASVAVELEGLQTDALGDGVGAVRERSMSRLLPPPTFGCWPTSSVFTTSLL